MPWDRRLGIFLALEGLDGASEGGGEGSSFPCFVAKARDFLWRQDSCDVSGSMTAKDGCKADPSDCEDLIVSTMGMGSFPVSSVVVRGDPFFFFFEIDSASFLDVEETALASFLLDSTLVERTWRARVETFAVDGLDEAELVELIAEISVLGPLSATELGGRECGREMSPLASGSRKLSPTSMVTLTLVSFQGDFQDCLNLALSSGGMDSC